MDKTAETAFFLVLLLLGAVTFVLAFDGIANAPCPDWSFHLCYAAGLDAVACDGGYGFYPPLLHVFAYAARGVGVGLEVFFALVLAVGMGLTAFLLWRHGGVTAVGVYFLFIPFFTVFVLRKPIYLWSSMVYCGLVPFVVACTLALLLFLEWGKLGWWRFTVVLVLLLVHSLGVVLAGLVFAALLFSRLARVRDGVGLLVASLVGMLVAVGFAFLGLTPFILASRLVVFVYFGVSLTVGLFIKGLREAYS